MTGAKRDWTFRDAGRLPLPLRLLDAAGRLAPGLPALDPDALVARAIRETGLDDFGGDEWREGLEVLCDGVEREADVHTFARIALRRLFSGLLERRLRLIQWAKDHPEVRDERIERPLVVLGLPRTGTTLLSHLLDLDPRIRSLRQWVGTALTPPPTLADHGLDPRIVAADRAEKGMARLIPPIRAMHPMDPLLPTECVPLHMLDFRSLGFETQILSPSYGAWLEQCDMRSAYAIHELALQTLQSTIPTDAWALKTPNHLWALDALLERYPDARLVWTHRDPKKVLPSVASLNTAFHRTFSNRADPIETGRAWMHKLLHGVSQGIAFDEKNDGKAWCHHLQYEDLMRDPVAAVRGLYAHFGMDWMPLHERRIRAFLRTRPQNAFGRHRYDMRDFGFTPEGIDERFSRYVERFDVPGETRD